MSPIIDDLRIEAEIPPKSPPPGTAVVITLRFYNIGPRVRTLFLIEDESYRFGQSTFHLQVGSGPPVVQPPPRDGYVPTTSDFHELLPRGQLEFKQTLRLPSDIKAGKYSVQWVYENQVDCWPVSPNTPSAGQPIPGIWLGRIVDSFMIGVSQPVIVRPG